MYPRISDLFNDLLGTDILLPFQTFGVFLALAFLVSYWVVWVEYRRLTAEGIMETRTVTVKEGGEIAFWEVLLSMGLYGLLGYKLGLLAVDYQGFSENPQAALLSTDGSLMGLLVGAIAGGGWRFWDYQKAKGTTAKEVKETQGISHELPAILIYAVLGTVVGGKIFHNLEYLDDFMADPIGQLFSFSGLTFYGGLIVASVFVIRHVRKKGYPLLPFLDVTSMSVIIGYGVGRIGCQMSGDGDWGIINNAPKPGWLSWAPDWLWAFDYPNNVLERCNPDPGSYDIPCNWAELGRLAEPVFPTPIYETLMALTIFGIMWFFRKRVVYWGQLFASFLVLSGLERFLIEKIRVNSTYNIFGAEITQAEIISSFMMLCGLAIFFLSTYVWKQKTPYKKNSK